MDRNPEEFRSLGFIGINIESFKTIFKRRRIFSLIVLALILPLSVLFLAESEVPNIFFVTNRDSGDDTVHNDIPESEPGHSVILLFVITLICLILFLLVYLVSTAAVVYSVACIYASKDLIFRKVMRAVPKMLKRVVVTFLWSIVVYFVFCLISAAFLAIWASLLLRSIIRTPYIVIWSVVFIVAYLYITVVCQLAYVVSVLEDDYGWKAIAKSKTLIKGKICAAVGCYMVWLVPLFGIQLVFEMFVSTDPYFTLNIGYRVLIGLACVVAVVLLNLLELVYEAVIYFVCKSYHHESVDRPSLARHLDGYSSIKDVQLEQVNNV